MPQGELLMLDPTVWATSDVHRMHEQSPLPIALYESPGWCSDFAIRSLESRGQDYRVAYRSDTSGGLQLAVSSLLSIAPHSTSTLPAGCREVHAAHGSAHIDQSSFVHSLPRTATYVTTPATTN